MPRLTPEQYAAYEVRRAGSISGVPVNAPPDPGPEAALHDYVAERCRALGLYAVHGRMDRAATFTVGAPDFIVAGPDGAVLWLELKAAQGKLTPEQQAAAAWLVKLGHRHAVARSRAEIEAALAGLGRPV